MLTNANKGTYLVKKWQKHANVIYERPLTESWGSSRFFYSKSGFNFSFGPLFETWENQNLGYFKNLSLEFGLNATRLSAQLSEHENPH